jgi:L-threonylcarbamoyladenylate synthase
VLSGPACLRVRPARPSARALSAAVAALSAGRLVAFPTETVYGLGADARQDDAVRAIYRAKGRPPDNPLILHVADAAAARALAADWPERARRLAATFWPGPLTLVVQGAPGMTAARAGLDTVAVRVPRSRLVRAMAAALGGPIAAPSANTSGRPSATRAEDVLADLGGAPELALVLDGGPCSNGVESTVVDVTQDPAAVLRPGALSVEQIVAALRPDRVVLAYGPSAPAGPARSPGMRHRHYAPSVPLVVAATPRELAVAVAAARRPGRRIGVLASRDGLAGLGAWEDVVWEELGRRSHPAMAARRLFSGMRRLEGAGVALIVAELPEERGMGRAVAERLRRAARGAPAGEGAP